MKGYFIFAQFFSCISVSILLYHFLNEELIIINDCGVIVTESDCYVEDQDSIPSSVLTENFNIHFAFTINDIKNVINR